MSTNLSDLPYNPPNQPTLPQRDIPRETIAHTTDAQVQPTYTPAPPPMQYEARPRKMDLMMEEFRFPIILSIMYFIFQTGAVNSIILKVSPGLFEASGALTMNGTVFKSLMFGAAYYGATILLDYLN